MDRTVELAMRKAFPEMTHEINCLIFLEMTLPIVMAIIIEFIIGSGLA